jgi:hypothetical protein
MKVSKDVRSLLERADPLRSESGMSEADAAQMRHAILSAARDSQAARMIPMIWPRAVAVAAAVVLLVVVATIAGSRRPGSVAAPPVEKAVAVPEAAGERLQLQFATPGGTRVIWTLDPEFKVGGVAP